MTIDFTRSLDEALIIADPDADEGTGATAAQAVGRDSRVLERMPRGLEHQPLLRIQRSGLGGRNTEERGVELVDIVDERSVERTEPFGFGFPWNTWDTTSHGAGLSVMASEYDQLTGTNASAPRRESPPGPRSSHPLRIIGCVILAR